MDPAVRNLVAALHAAPMRYALCLTGGGANAAGWLLSVPGGSRTVLEVAIPYGEEALADYLGHHPDSYCSAATSRDMARRAFDRAGWLSPGELVAGIACTASLRSDRPKRGDHRCHVTIHTLRKALTFSVTLTKDDRDREAEEDVVDRVLLNAMVEALGIAERAPVPLLPGEAVQMENRHAADPLTRFLAQELSAVCVECDGRHRTDAPGPALLLPGSFNPLHEGHWRLAQAAEKLTGLPAAFELAAINAEKGALPDAEVCRRLQQFGWRAPLWLTRAATFPAKAELFPGAIFAVGADTAARIVQARFYENSETRMAESLSAFRARGCRFLVAGRALENGVFVSLANLAIPENLHDLFAEIPEADFRFDVSSTQLRAE